MSQAPRHYIQARPLHEATVRLAPAVYYHGRFAGFSAEAHAHTETAQILLPLGGRMHLVAGGEDHLIGPEWGALILPGIRHGFNHLDGELDFISVEMPPAAIAELAGAIALPFDPARGVHVVRDVRLWLQGQQLAHELDGPQPGHERVLQAGFEQLATYFLRASLAPAPAPTAKEPRVLRAVERMLRDFAEPLGVEELAAEQAMSARHFERCFKEAIGRSPKRFLIEVRVGAAQALLAQTDRPISAIAVDVGFSHPSHFAETFQKLTGKTPRAYRQERGV